MKQRLLFLITAVLLAGTTGAQQPEIFDAQRGDIVFVNLEQAFNDFYKTKLAKGKIELQKKDIADEKQVLVDELTAIDEEVNTLKKEARDTTLAEEIRDGKRLLYEERLLDLRAKQKEIEEFQALRDQQMQLQLVRMGQKIMDEIRSTVVEYGRNNGLMSIIDTSKRQAAVSVFVYTHPSVDITEDIVSILNSKRPEHLDEDGQLVEEQEPAAPEGEASE